MKYFSKLFVLGLLVLTGCTPHVGLELSSSDVQTHVVAEGDAYCGASEGSVVSEGNYTIQSYVKGVQVDELALGPLTLVSGEPHDDLHLLPMPFNGQDLYQLSQYESCNSESTRLFTMDALGKIHALRFLKNGTILSEVSTDEAGSIGFQDGTFSFCPYDNTTGEFVCDFYESNGEDLEYVNTHRYPFAGF